MKFECVFRIIEIYGWMAAKIIFLAWKMVRFEKSQFRSGKEMRNLNAKSIFYGRPCASKTYIHCIRYLFVYCLLHFLRKKIFNEWFLFYFYHLFWNLEIDFNHFEKCVLLEWVTKLFPTNIMHFSMILIQDFTISSF